MAKMGQFWVAINNTLTKKENSLILNANMEVAKLELREPE